MIVASCDLLLCLTLVGVVGFDFGADDISFGFMNGCH